MSRLLAGSLTLAAAALLPAGAHAKCAPPRAFIAPASGATLPPNPILHVFVPFGMAADGGGDAAGPTVDLSADGAAVASHVEIVSRAPAFWTYRVTIAHAAPARLEVRIDLPGAGPPRLEASYVIGTAGTPAAVPSRTIGGAKRETRFWTCSHQLTWNVPLYVEAPAYRLEWAHSRASYEAGARASLVVPRRMESFFKWRDEPDPSPARVELGHVDCLGTTVSWPTARPVWAAVWALQPDGTEIALNDEPIVLSKP